jgi:chromosome segregation ATPase
MLTIQEIILAFALIGVLGGWALGRLGARFGRRQAGAAGDPATGHRIRSLEVELKVVQRKAEEAELALERDRETVVQLRAELAAAQAAVADRDEEIRQLRQSLANECTKTQDLRLELTHRAEETIRASVRVKDAETELSVARAGSDAVLEQIQRLAAEREELTGRLRVLQAELAGAPPAPSKVTRLPLRDPKDR